MERGDRTEAENQWRAVLAECPGDREALSHLGAPAQRDGHQHLEPER
jgi:hypothetical protein